MVVFKLKKYFPETKLITILKDKEKNKIINRKRKRSPKFFIKPNCSEIAIIDLKNNEMKMYDPVNKKRVPLSAIIEIYKYRTPLQAKKNYDYMKYGKNMWVEVGHGNVYYFTGKYSFRVSSLGPDNLLKDVTSITSNALIEYINITKSVKQ